MYDFPLNILDILSKIIDFYISDLKPLHRDYKLIFYLKMLYKGYMFVIIIECFFMDNFCFFLSVFLGSISICDKYFFLMFFLGSIASPLVPDLEPWL